MLSAGLLRARGVRTLSGLCLRAPLLPELQSRPLKVLCTIDGARLSLFRAPEGVAFTEPGVTVGAKDEITTASSLHGLRVEKDVVQVIVRPPSYKRTPLNVVQYNRRSGDLVWKDDTFKSFPVGRVENFKTLRQRPDLCFFDKTAFIMALESISARALTFLRPHGSGKSLTVSTLAHFHGREHLPDYKPLFEGLAIDEHVTNNRISPGQFFVLQIDFSKVDWSKDRNVAKHSLNLMLNESIKQFYRTYEPYLRMPADYLIEEYMEDNAAGSLTACANLVDYTLKRISCREDPLSKIKGIYIMADNYDSPTNEYLALMDTVHWKPPRGQFPDSLLHAFWACVKSVFCRGISRCYMTGVTPLSFAGVISGFDIAWPVSWEPELAGFGGLTEADVAVTLALREVCGTASEAKKHLKTMRDHYSGFNFTLGEQGPLIYNTNSCLEYLQHLAEGMPMENPLSVTNSKVSEAELQLLADSPLMTRLLKEGVFSGSEPDKNVEERMIPYDDDYNIRGRSFILSILADDLARKKAAWLSYMVHIGGLTFCLDKKALRIPNLVAAERIRSAILHRRDASLKNVKGTF
ncbi:MAG: hypothetical protein J3Q66DRAFT_352384 [Benniella sp.]|nr:MAG: hypothetical protein J3Q66DRAFT_352384 [Benniella sp.]